MVEMCVRRQQGDGTDDDVYILVTIRSFLQCDTNQLLQCIAGEQCILVGQSAPGSSNDSC